MQRVDVSILGREYTLACTPDQKETLASAARHVDQRMQSLKASGKIIGNERIAVIAAIQVAVELLSVKATDGPLANVALGDFKAKIQTVNDLLDQVQTLQNTAQQ